MSMPTGPLLDALSEKLSRLAALTDEDRQAILGLPVIRLALRHNTYIVREGATNDLLTIVRSGMVYSSKVAGDGGRMIVAIHMAGDIIGCLGGKPLPADCDVQALTTCELAQVPSQSLVDLAATSPGITEALLRDREVGSAILREWALNAGRRNARARVAHLICEIAVRQSVAGMGLRRSFEFPLTQEQIADALGLTTVHVNRTVQQLRRDGLIEGAGKVMAIPNWNGLASEGDFQPEYLHLPPEVPAEALRADKGHYLLRAV